MKKTTNRHISCVFTIVLGLVILYTHAAHAYGTPWPLTASDFAVSERNGKYGVIDVAQGVELLPCVHDELEILGRDFIKTSCNGYVLYYNLNDQKRNQPLPYAIADIYAQNGYILVARQNQYGLLNAQSVMVLDIQFERIEHVKEDLWRVFYMGDCRVVNIVSHNETPCEDYDLANRPQTPEKRYEIRYKKTDNGKLAGVYDLKAQNFIVPQLYHNVLFLPGDKFLVFAAGPAGRDINYGLYDHTGKMLAEPVYDAYNPIWSSNAAAQTEQPSYRFTKNGKTGIIDITTGKVISPFVYTAILDTNGIYAPITHDREKYGLLNRVTGKEALPPTYDRITMTDPHAVDTYYVVLNGQRGLFYHGKLTLPTVYSEIRLLDDQYAVVKTQNGYGLRNYNTGAVIFPPVFANISWFYYGEPETGETQPQKVFVLTLKLLNKDLTFLLEYGTFQQLPQISINGKPYVKRNAPYVVYNDQNDKWGLYSGTNGQELAPRVYDSIEVTFSETPTALLYIYDQNSDSAVDVVNTLTGQKLTPKSLQAANMLNHDYMLARSGDKLGVFNVKTQKWTLPLEYDFIDDVIINGHIVAAQNGKFGVVNIADGQIVIPFIYDDIAAAIMENL